jgi:hypothetical protein
VTTAHAEKGPPGTDGGVWHGLEGGKNWAHSTASRRGGHRGCLDRPFTHARRGLRDNPNGRARPPRARRAALNPTDHDRRRRRFLRRLTFELHDRLRRIAGRASSASTSERRRKARPDPKAARFATLTAPFFGSRHAKGTMNLGGNRALSA